MTHSLTILDLLNSQSEGEQETFEGPLDEWKNAKRYYLSEGFNTGRRRIYRRISYLFCYTERGWITSRPITLLNVDLKIKSNRQTLWTDNAKPDPLWLNLLLKREMHWEKYPNCKWHNGIHEYTSLPGILTSVDFSKAFDLIEVFFFVCL